jgi:hypothetical protein
MTKAKKVVIGMLMISLLTVGVIGLAGTGFGEGIKTTNNTVAERPLDCSSDGEMNGYGQGLSSDRPLDGSGYGARAGGGQGTRSGNGLGECMN